MNIEQKIRNNAASFDDVRMPAGSRERFEARLKQVATPVRVDDRVRKLRFMTWTSVAAAAITIIMVISGIVLDGKITTKVPQTADNELIKMRQAYDAKMDEAIANLEDLMAGADENTRMQINSVISDLMDMEDVFAEMAPLPEDRQMAIAEQIYDNNLRTIELITDKINK